MELKISTKLALSIALLITFFNFILLVFTFNLSVYKVLTIVLAVFLFAFIIIRLFFQNFIEKHLKRIFNIIYADKTTMKQENSLVNLLNDAEKWKSNQQFDLDNLQKQNNYRKEFIGNLSHELKTPLFSIQGYIETLLDGGINDANINIAYLKKAVNNIERLSAIVKDVDTIAKVESDALNLNKTNFNILDLVKNTSENLELFADKNDVELIVNENSKSAKVFADKEKIKTILVNLITNAIKYGKENGTTNILVSVVMNRVVVEISDNGIGIKEDQLPRVFERFYRIDSNRSREQGGSGLGLAIVKHIIEAHNENINLKSTFGEGTIVTFTLKKI